MKEFTGIISMLRRVNAHTFFPLVPKLKGNYLNQITTRELSVSAYSKVVPEVIKNEVRPVSSRGMGGYSFFLTAHDFMKHPDKEAMKKMATLVERKSIKTMPLTPEDHEAKRLLSEDAGTIRQFNGY